MAKNSRPTISLPDKTTKSSSDVVAKDLFDTPADAQKPRTDVRAPMAARPGKHSASEPKPFQNDTENVADDTQANVTADDERHSEYRVASDSLGRSRKSSSFRPSGSLEDISSSVRGAIAFFIVAAIGIVFIVAAKLSHLDPFEIVIVPVALMLAYACIMLAIPKLRLRDDQAGDNLYYLGFLFTLTSIGVSLYQFTGAASADEIVSNFGIAVTSTITGLMLRIAFNQMRSDPAQVERVSRHELSDASRRLRRELDTITREMSALGRTTHQKTRDILDVQLELVTAVKDLLSEAKSSLNDVNRNELATKAFHQLEEITEAVRTSRDGLKQVIDGSTKEIVTHWSSSTKTLVAELEKQSNSSLAIAKDANTSFEMIGSHLQMFVDSQQEILNALSVLNDTVSATSQGRAPVRQFGKTKRRWKWLPFLRRNG